MPHVVINGKFNPTEIFPDLSSVFIKEGSTILKTTDQFLAKNKQSILVESIVIEEHVKNQFFAMINKREDGIVVRIHPIFVIEKTPGVKRIIAEIGKFFLKLNQQATISKTNLQEYLK
jgi:hypothetical protein